MINHNWSYEITALNLSIITTSRPLFQFLLYLQLIIFFANSKHCFSQYLAIRNQAKFCVNIILHINFIECFYIIKFFNINLPTSDANRILNSVHITGNILSAYYINFFVKYQVR